MADIEIEDVPKNILKTVEGAIPLWSANVRSSCISSIHYDIKTGSLTITFRDGATHTYEDVPPTVYVGLMMSRSKGSYFNANIRKVYNIA